MDNEKFTINMQIGGYPIRLRIAREDEEIYRNAEKNVKEIYNQLHKAYSEKSVEELWMLSAFQAAVIVNRNKKLEDASSLTKKIDELEKEIDTVLL